MKDLPTRDEIIGKKFAGHTVNAFLNAEDDCHWYEAHSDSNENAILYVYRSSAERDNACKHIHGYRTSFNETFDPSKNRILFAALGAHRVMMRIELRKLLMDSSTRPHSIGGFTINEVLGFGYKGVTYKVTRENGPRTPYALKVTIAEEYEGTTVLPEVERMVDVAEADRDHFPQIHSFDTYEYIHNSMRYTLVYFVEDYISGTTLEKILEKDSHDLDEMFLYHFIHETLSAVATLQACDLMHDDLHSGNIMLHEPPAGQRRPYLIDFGSAKPRATTRKQRDDIRNLASHFAQIANAVQQHTTARTMHGERVLVACENLLTVITDDDPLRRPEDAKSLLDHFNRSFQIGSVKQELLHPFDFGNAEEVEDNSLLYSLAAKSFPWQEQISASSHLLVIGPRGCGKTTVFRSMSFACLADAGHLDVALEKGYLGLYVSCNKEFRLRFSAIDSARLLSQQDEIRHYFHLVVLRELASVLVAMEREDKIAPADIKAVTSFAQEQIPSAFPTSPTSSALDLEVVVTRAVHEARMAIWNGSGIDVSTTQGFLADLATMISTRIAPFAGKTLYLFVDDYTEGKVPREAQQALNHILFVPNASYKCKISSEVFGVIQDEVFDNFLDQDREYKEWNLGTLYCVALPPKDQKEFLKEIVDKRLELCGYTGRVDSVIGASSYAFGTFERTLKKEHSLRQKNKESSSAPTDIVEKQADAAVIASGTAAYYHGWDTICNLCTGDVSNILELLNRMFKECNVKKDHISAIPADHQDSVITGYSRQYISKVKGIPRYGDRLFAIVDAFGNMARRLLEEYPLVSHGDGREEPYRLLRIELDEAFSGDIESAHENNAGDDALDLWKLIQRHCIFIDADEGRSRRHTLSSRVVLRRIFCPAFRIGLVNSESYTVSRQEWKAFCADPAGRRDQYVKVCVQRALKKRGMLPSDRQQTLFDNSDEATST